MDIHYIFLLKNKERKKFENNEIENKLLVKLFDNVTDCLCEFEYNKKKHTFKYATFYESSTMAKLEISLGNKSFNDAKILNNINDLICKSQLRKDYSIILAYDGVSNYFCNKGYCLISEFERKLRELIYIILMKTFGVEWYEKTVSDDLKNKIKEISKGKNNAVLIESALQEMTINDLETYLFEPYYETQIDTFIKNKEDIEKLFSEKTKEEIVALLEECIPKSLWERFFENKIENIHNEVNQIRAFRNVVSHNKQFYLKNYNKFCNVIKSTLSKIESAIYALNKKDIDNKLKLESSIAYSQLYKNLLVDQVSGVQEMVKQAAKIQEALRSPAIQQIAEQAARVQEALRSPAMQQIAEQGARVQEALRSPAIQQIAEQAARMRETIGSSGLQQIVEQSARMQKILKCK